MHEVNTGSVSPAVSGMAHAPLRFASVVALRPDKADEYLRLHRAVWPAVLAQITASGIRNFSIFLHDGVLFSYYEYIGSDHESDMANMAADPATQRWWSHTDPCQQPMPGTDPGGLWTQIDEIFHTD